MLRNYFLICCVVFSFVLLLSLFEDGHRLFGKLGQGLMTYPD